MPGPPGGRPAPPSGLFRVGGAGARPARSSSPTSVETAPASGGTARAASVVARATTGMPRCIASRRDRPSDVQRSGWTYTRQRASSRWSSSVGRSPRTVRRGRRQPCVPRQLVSAHAEHLDRRRGGEPRQAGPSRSPGRGGRARSPPRPAPAVRRCRAGPGPGCRVPPPRSGPSRCPRTSSLKCVTWTTGMVCWSASGCRVNGKVPFGRVVFQEHRREVDARPPAQRAGHLVDFLRPLKDDGVDAVRVEPAERQPPALTPASPCPRGPAPKGRRREVRAGDTHAVRGRRRPSRNRGHATAGSSLVPHLPPGGQR